MADLQSVIGLLHRADWTQLSMSADVRFERDNDLALSRLRAMRPPGKPGVRLGAGPDGWPPTWEELPDEEWGGYHSGRATLLIAPGGRYRQEFGGEPPGQVRGSDGERGWTWYRSDLAPPRCSRSPPTTRRRSPNSSALPGCSAGSPWKYGDPRPPAAATRSRSRPPGGPASRTYLACAATFRPP